MSRIGWLVLALGTCSSVLLALAFLGGGVPRHRNAGPVRIEPAQAHVRGRALSSLRARTPALVATLARRRSVEASRLVREHSPAARPSDEGLAALAGRITHEGRGVLAHIRFELGWNEGRVLDTTGDGGFSGHGLAPGYQLVTVTSEGLPACRRSLFLAPYREGSFELDFGVPRTARVRVLAPDGLPVEGAEVELDGTPGTTDAEGRAWLLSACSGAPELVVRAPGCAWFTCALEGSVEEFDVRLEPACVLELHMPTLAGAAEVLVYLLPHGSERLAGRPLRPATPWHLMSPLRVVPGATVRLENLPAGELEVRALHPDAHIATEHAILDSEHPLSLTLRNPESSPEEAPDLGSVHGLLSSAGLGTLPRLQPLARHR